MISTPLFLILFDLVVGNLIIDSLMDKQFFFKVLGIMVIREKFIEQRAINQTLNLIEFTDE